MRVDVGVALVAAQVTAAAGLVAPGRRHWRLPVTGRAAAGVLMLAGAGLAVAGAGALGPNLRPTPAVPAGAPLCTEGVYGVGRHPIYAGLLVTGAAVVALRGRVEPVVALGVLGVVLHVKAGHEERLLRERFGAAYDEYARRVPRLLPH